MGAATGLCIVPKLKYEHIYLNSFSKMRVDLAAQVAIMHQYIDIISLQCLLKLMTGT